MKALSGWAEYFWLLAKNIKPVENRTWSLTKYIRREKLPIPIYLHASKTPAPKADVAFIRRHLLPDELKEFDAVNWKALRGCIIGQVFITGEVTAEDTGMKAVRTCWFTGPYGFLVEHGRLYDDPHPCKGQLGFFEVNPLIKQTMNEEASIETN